MNKQVEVLKLYNVRKYDEELFTNLFGLRNKIEIRIIFIEFHQSLSNEDVKNFFTKLYKKIRSLQTQNIVSNEVSCFL